MRGARRLACGLLPMLLAGCVAPGARDVPSPLVVAAPAPPAPVIDAGLPIGFALEGVARQGGLMRGRIGGADIASVRLTLDGRLIQIAPDGRFLIGFGRDAGPLAMLTAARSGRLIGSEKIHVAPREWNIQSLPTLPRGTTPTPEFLARREPELARIAAARAAASASDGWRQRFVWPARGRISGVFGSQRVYAGEPGAYHGGVDIAKPTGAAVIAPADGVVVLAADAPFTLEGNLLMIDHGMGLVSAFLHLSRIDLRVGDHVRQGQPIGAVGATGRATGPHLHWGMTWQDVRIDPALLAGPMPGG